MLIFDIIIGLTLFVSVIICIFSLKRLAAYNKKHNLDESKYTRLFGIFTKEHVAATYVAFVALHSIFSIWLIFAL